MRCAFAAAAASRRLDHTAHRRARTRCCGSPAGASRPSARAAARSFPALSGRRIVSSRRSSAARIARCAPAARARRAASSALRALMAPSATRAAQRGAFLAGWQPPRRRRAPPLTRATPPAARSVASRRPPPPAAAAEMADGALRREPVRLPSLPPKCRRPRARARTLPSRRREPHRAPLRHPPAVADAGAVRRLCPRQDKGKAKKVVEVEEEEEEEEAVRTRRCWRTRGGARRHDADAWARCRPEAPHAARVRASAAAPRLASALLHRAARTPTPRALPARTPAPTRLLACSVWFAAR
jgi:hypothetical protein